MSLMDLKSRVPDGESGDWRVERRDVKEIDVMFYNMKNPSRAVPPGLYTHLVYRGDIIMSDTPAEIRDHAAVYDRATGAVLINGLGLGVILQAIVEKPDVTSITVIEISSDVIKLVAPSFDDPRVTIHQGNALTWQPPKGAYYDVVWHDIWPHICADNLDEMATLHRRYAKRSGWQSSWARSECERLRRESERLRREREWGL